MPSQYGNITRSKLDNSTAIIQCYVRSVRFTKANGQFLRERQYYTCGISTYRLIIYFVRCILSPITLECINSRLPSLSLFLFTLASFSKYKTHTVQSRRVEPAYYILYSVGRFDSAHWTSRVTCVKQIPPCIHFSDRLDPLPTDRGSRFILLYMFLYSPHIYQPHLTLRRYHVLLPRLDDAERKAKSSNE